VAALVWIVSAQLAQPVAKRALARCQVIPRFAFQDRALMASSTELPSRMRPGQLDHRERRCESAVDLAKPKPA
jgi:predicted cupin superfamily sugar epimerase